VVQVETQALLLETCVRVLSSTMALRLVLTSILLTLAFMNTVQAAHPNPDNKKPEEEAAATLKEMLQLIHEGHFENHFFDGEILKSPPQSNREHVGSCILDKALGIKGSEFDKVAINELKIDLAACCTKSEEEEAACVKDSSKAYSLLSDVLATSDMNNKHKLGAQASALLIRAANKRLTKEQLKPEHMHLVEVCAEKDWVKCTWRDLLDHDDAAARKRSEL